MSGFPAHIRGARPRPTPRRQASGPRGRRRRPRAALGACNVQDATGLAASHAISRLHAIAFNRLPSELGFIIHPDVFTARLLVEARSLRSAKRRVAVDGAVVAVAEEASAARRAAAANAPASHRKRHPPPPRHRASHMPSSASAVTRRLIPPTPTAARQRERLAILGGSERSEGFEAPEIPGGMCHSSSSATRQANAAHSSTGASNSRCARVGHRRARPRGRGRATSSSTCPAATTAEEPAARAAGWRPPPAPRRTSSVTVSSARTSARVAARAKRESVELRVKRGDDVVAQHRLERGRQACTLSTSAARSPPRQLCQPASAARAQRACRSPVRTASPPNATGAHSRRILTRGGYGLRRASGAKSGDAAARTSA